MTKRTSFIGRTKEMRLLEGLTHKQSSSLVVIHGRRRIGKSRLVDEFGKRYRFFKFSGLPPTRLVTPQDQREEFARQLSKIMTVPFDQVQDWGNLFTLVAQETKQGRVVILLDEISWMGSQDPLFLGKLKNAWDMEFKQNPELILILCGSVSSWIEDNILKSTGFMGRVSLTLNMQELSLPECNRLLDNLGFRGSDYDKFKLLSVMGGIPRYLEEVQPQLTAEANIQELCFRPGGVLFREFNDMFSDLFSQKSKTYKNIIMSLVRGPQELMTISQETGLELGGYLSDCLQDLAQLGFVRREYAWNLKTAKQSRLSHFRLSDNYLRFYLKYIEPSSGKIAGDRMGQTSLITLPGWDSIMGLQFENLVMANRPLIWRALSLSPMEIAYDNPFFQRKTTRSKGCQIDYLIQTRRNNLFVCEMKFSKNAIGHQVTDEVAEKTKRLSSPRGFSCWPVLIHVNGVTDAVSDSNEFSQIIDFSSFLHEG